MEIRFSSNSSCLHADSSLLQLTEVMVEAEHLYRHRNAPTSFLLVMRQKNNKKTTRLFGMNVFPSFETRANDQVKFTLKINRTQTYKHMNNLIFLIKHQKQYTTWRMSVRHEVYTVQELFEPK